MQGVTLAGLGYVKHWNQSKRDWVGIWSQSHRCSHTYKEGLKSGISLQARSLEMDRKQKSETAIKLWAIKRRLSGVRLKPSGATEFVRWIQDVSAPTCSLAPTFKGHHSPFQPDPIFLCHPASLTYHHVHVLTLELTVSLTLILFENHPLEHFMSYMAYPYAQCTAVKKKNATTDSYSWNISVFN